LKQHRGETMRPFDAGRSQPVTPWTHPKSARRFIGRMGLLLVVALSVPRGAEAQDTRGYVGVSGVFSSQGSTRPGPGPSNPQTGVGGTALGVSGAIGTLLTPRVSLAFEFSVPARFESMQEIDYMSFIARFDNHHRDWILSGLFHFDWPTTRSVHVELVVGPSVVREDTLQSTANGLTSGPPAYAFTGAYGPFGPETSVARWSVGISGGVDVGVRLSPRVELVPQFRLHWIERATYGDSDQVLGLSSVVVRPALGVRVRF
jgi:hypothetical protein